MNVIGAEILIPIMSILWVITVISKIIHNITKRKTIEKIWETTFVSMFVILIIWALINIAADIVNGIWWIIT